MICQLFVDNFMDELDDQVPHAYHKVCCLPPWIKASVHVFYYWWTWLAYTNLILQIHTPPQWMNNIAFSSLNICHMQQHVHVEFPLDFCPCHTKILLHQVSLFSHCLMVIIIFLVMLHVYMSNIKVVLSITKSIAYSLLICIYSVHNVLTLVNLDLSVLYFSNVSCICTCVCV